jgi:hypothetical protein
MKPAAACRSAVILGFILALAGPAWANGEEFFAPAKDGQIDLVYFGRIKDSQTGRSVTDSVYFLLTDKSTGLSFQFTSDKPGHYRTPDIGAAIKGIGETINVNAFEVSTVVAGYKKALITRMPRKTQGAVELDVRLDPVESEVSAAGVSAQTAPPYMWIVLGGAVVLALVKGAMTLGRQRSSAP